MKDGVNEDCISLTHSRIQYSRNEIIHSPTVMLLLCNNIPKTDMSSNHQSTKCVYYPYSRAISVETLKKSVLLFDEVVFLDSQPWFIRQELLGNEYGIDGTNIEKPYDFLKEEGIITIKDPKQYTKTYDELLTANVVNDMNNDEFVKQAIDHNVETWDVMAERIPPSFFKVFYIGSGSFKEAVTLQALIKENGDIEKIPERYRPFASVFRSRESDRENGPTDRYRELYDNHYKFVIGSNPQVRMETYEIPFLQASSLRMNEALLFSSLEEYIPFTDSAIHDKLLRAKIGNSISFLTDNEQISEQIGVDISMNISRRVAKKIGVDVPINISRQHLAITILDRLLPEEELEERTLPELVEYRKSNSDEFERFHVKISELSSEIESITPSYDYEKKLQRIVNSKVIPEIEAARDDLISEYEQSFGDIALKAGQVAGPTLVATSLAGLGIWEVLGACAMAEVGVFASEGAKALEQSWRARRRQKRTPFAYFSDL